MNDALQSGSADYGHAFVDHTADVMADCWGRGFPALLMAAADVLYETALEERRRDRGHVQTVELNAKGCEDMLVRWLQELLFLLEAEQFVGVSFSFQEAGPERLAASVEGYHHAPEERGPEIKAATYHGLEVRREGDLYKARIVLDL
ncbi:MAG: archease [Candidatus Hydrogenedentota bacterium]